MPMNYYEYLQQNAPSAYNNLFNLGGAPDMSPGGTGTAAAAGLGTPQQYSQVMDPYGNPVSRGDAQWTINPSNGQSMFVPNSVATDWSSLLNVGNMATDVPGLGNALGEQPAVQTQQAGAQVPIPARSREYPIVNAPSITTPGGSPDLMNQFFNWWNSSQQQMPWQPGAAMMDYTGLAQYNPATGQNLGGPTDIGAIYNQFGIPTPWVGKSGQSYLPGQDYSQGSYNTDMMRNNPGEFISWLQANQLESGIKPGGPISPWVPPQTGGGFPASAAFGGAYSPGQLLAQWQQKYPYYDVGAHGMPTQPPPGYGGGGFPLYSPGGPGTGPGQLPGGGGAPGGGGVPSGGGGGGGGIPFPYPGGSPGPTGGGGGGGVPPSGGNPFPGGDTPPSGMPGTPGMGNYYGSADQALAQGGGDLGYLRNIVQNAGFATDTQPAWEAMKAAQQRNLQERFADLTEGFNVSGNRFSTAFGNASTDFWNQAGLDQNALLGQLTIQSQEAARAREMQSAGMLGQFGQQGMQQLSAQDFQSQMLRMQQQMQAAQGLYGGGSQAAQLMAQLGAQGAMGLLGGSIQGAQGMFGAENQAGLAEAQRQLMLQQMGLGAAVNLDQLWNQNLQTGAQLGGQQYGIQQDQISRMMQQYFMENPQADINQLLPYMYAAATGYPPMLQTGVKQSFGDLLGSILGGAGGILGGISKFI